MDSVAGFPSVKYYLIPQNELALFVKRSLDIVISALSLVILMPLSCLWQVNGRNQISDFNDWCRLDLEYIDQWSLWLDCKILMKTVWVVLKGTGC